MRGSCLALTMVMAGASGLAQIPLGTVDIAGAEVTTAQGAVPVSEGRQKLVGSSTVTAKEGRNAEVSLARGGEVLVCQTSVLHATPSADSLLLALDRGAMEIRMKVSATDVVMTPDMRVSMGGAQAGQAELDLRMRVTRNGDTCVENRGRKAPTLNITDAFGDAAYQVKPGQHVLFEHGNLREVVDRETTPCGCPALEKPGVTVADAILSGGKTTAHAADAQPFPAAVSEGLAAPTPVAPDSPPGGTHVQIATSLTFDPSAPPPPAAPTAATAPAAEPAKGGPFRAMGRFFKRIFVH